LKKLTSIFRGFAGKFTIFDTWKRHIFTRILQCGTGMLGVTSYKCLNCSHVERGGSTCGSRNCPECGAGDRQEWADNTAQKFLPVPHFHAVFTLPHEINSLVEAHPKLFLDTLMKSVAATLTKFFRNRYEGTPAFLMVLHTWTQTLMPHYHVHVLIAAGVYGKNRWVAHQSGILFPVRAMAKVFRGIFLERLISETNDSKSPLFNIQLPAMPNRWNVYCAPPHSGTETAIKYFATYVNRAGISNSRILSHDADDVTIALKRDIHERDNDSQSTSAGKSAPKGKSFKLPVQELIRRFLYHILPKGFTKVRYGGLYASASKDYLAAKTFLNRNSTNKPNLIKKKTIRLCPVCKLAPMRFTHRSLPCEPYAQPP
jgi:hypothetical protein